MKRFFTIAMILVAAGSAVAQETDGVKTDTIKVKKDETTTIVVSGDGVAITFGDKDKDRTISVGDKGKKKKKKGAFDFGIFNGLDLGFNAFMLNGDLNLPAEYDDFEQKIGNSTNVQLRFLNVDFRPSSFVRMNFALALDYNDWALENDVTLQPDQEVVTFLQEDIHFNKNKFKAKYLALPFNLQFRTTNDITFTGGFEPQFLLRGRVKQRSDERGKTKVNDNFNLREFRYAWVGRIGYDGFSVFCRYYPQSIFADNEGPDMQNISFGVGWGL